MFVVTEGEDAKSEEALEDVHRYSDKTILEDCSLIYHVRGRGGPGGCSQVPVPVLHWVKGYGRFFPNVKGKREKAM